MKTLFASGVFALVMAFGASAFAAEEAAAAVSTDGATSSVTAPREFHPFVVGAFMSMGAALGVGNFDDGYFNTLWFDSKIPRFAGAGGAYFDWYLNDMWALEGGLGFVGKGFILKLDEGDVKCRQTFIDLEIPLGAKLSVSNFQIALAVTIDFIVSGKIRTTAGDDKNIHSMSGSDWDDIRRFNLGPKLNLGYSLTLGPLFLVPGISWQMDLIDMAKTDDIGMRRMNIMIVVAGEFGFGDAE